MSNSIFNEDNYLNGNKENLRFFAENYQDRLERCEIEKNKFANILNNYDEFITMVAKYLKQIGLKNPLEYSMFIKLLIDKGYLSQNLLLEKKGPKENQEITSSLGTSIIIGNGCCRHYTKMHQDIFNKLDLPFFMFYCYQGETPYPSIKDEEANHVISLIPYDEQVYGLEIYSGYRLFGFKDPFTLEEISTKTHYTLRYKPYFELIMGESTIPHIKRRLNAFELVADRYSIEPKEWEHKKEQMKKKIFFLNECCIPYEIHEATEVLKDEIALEMKSLLK